MTNPRHQERQLHWKWIVASIVVGLIFVGASYFIVAPTLHSPEVQVLVMLIGFITMGTIIGYFSPGITIKESTIGGAIVLLIMLILLLLLKTKDIQQTVILDFLLLLMGISFSWIGGWVGEQLQGSTEEEGEHRPKGFQWRWVIIGVIVGFALINFVVFVIGALIVTHIMKTAFIGFVLSLVVTGFIVGLHSPGETIKEPAVAGIIAVLLDWIFIDLIVQLHVPLSYLLTGLIMGFLLTLFGGWLGEKYQESTVKSQKISSQKTE
ncbi:MAG: hypothetical protein N3A63_01830 [Bacteroidetes bacterium]|nr:hypothetical protein [Bacteroidota bacterium]